MNGRIVRALELSEVETLIDWAAAEGWNPGLEDATAFHAADPAGFIGALVDGRMVAGISAVAYGDDYGFIGLYISDREFRGQGHGKAVWDAGIAHLAGRTIGLDGVDEQFENYRSKGFEPAYRTTRFSGVCAAPRTDEPPVVVVTRELLQQIYEFDRRIFPSHRDAFLQHWLEPPHLAMAAMSGDRVLGYAAMRECREGWKIGPLAATDDAAALALLRTLSSYAPGEVHLDVPAVKAKFVATLHQYGLRPGLETTRMYRGEPPRFAQELFAVTTLELG